MIEASDYSRLLAIRNEIFPTFDVDQEAAARTIVGNTRHLMEKHCIATIVDLGCGTAEILRSVRAQLIAREQQVECVGIDCCAAEIAYARRTCPECEFVEQRVEEYVRDPIGCVDSLASARTLLMCVGHTIPHLDSITDVLDDIARWRPAVILIDFHEEWDLTVRHFDSAHAPPLQRGLYTSNALGEVGGYVLTTKRDPEHADRVVRGIERLENGKIVPTGFWTTQLRKESEWFRAELRRRGYAAEDEVAYRGGYGSMKGVLMSRGRSPWR